MGSTLKGRNLLPQEQIPTFKSRPYFRRAVSSMEADRKSQKAVFICKNGRKYDNVTGHLNMSQWMLKEIGNDGKSMFMADNL